MKLLKVLFTILVITSLLLIAGCGSSTKSDYTGNWYGISNQGEINKITLEKQGETYLVSHTKYIFRYPEMFDNGTYTKNNLTEAGIPVNLVRKNYVQQQTTNIKDGILQLPQNGYNSTLVFKNNKLTGKPDEDYGEQSITFEKMAPEKSKEIYNKAKETFKKYVSTREKYPIQIEDLKFYPNKYIKDEFKDYDKF